MTQAERVVSVARAELGVTESPANSNRVKYWTEYDPGFQGQPWCVVFVWWVFRTAGLSGLFLGGGRTANCGTLLRWYREQGWTVPVAEARPGDIVILNFSGTQSADHCGIVAERVCTGEKYIRTIEGNTSPGAEGSQDNGGCVALKYRAYYQIVGVCRPQYKEEKPPDYSGHWAEQDIKWAIDNGLMTGYKDGSFQPDKAITRAEAITLLRRYHRMQMEDDIK